MNDICAFAPSSTTLSTLFCETYFFSERDDRYDVVFEGVLQSMRRGGKSVSCLLHEVADRMYSSVAVVSLSKVAFRRAFCEWASDRSTDTDDLLFAKRVYVQKGRQDIVLLPKALSMAR